MSLEARLLPPESWLGRVSNELVASAFIDAGFVRYRRKTAVASGATLANTGTFTGAGVGLSWVRPTEYAARLSLAMPLSGKPRSDTLVRKPRLNLLVSWFFN